jgi:hypothetical protein
MEHPQRLGGDEMSSPECTTPVPDIPDELIGITKLELLSRLSPMLDTDREYAQALAILNEIMGDYVRALREALDTLVEVPDA